MSIFDNPSYHTYIAVGKEAPVEKQAYKGTRIYPFEEINIPTQNTIIKGIVQIEDLYLGNVANANIIIKTGNSKKLAYSTHIPRIGCEIPIKCINSNMGNPDYKKSILKIEKIIKLCTNCYVINPNSTNEWILVTPEP